MLPGKSQNSKLKITRDLQRLEAKNSQKCQNLGKKAKFWTYLNFPDMQSMIFSKRPINTTSIPKIRNIIVAFGNYRSKALKTVNFGQKLAKILSKIAKILSYQSFPGIQSIIFSRKTIRKTSIPTIRKIHSSIWK